MDLRNSVILSTMINVKSKSINPAKYIITDDVQATSENSCMNTNIKPNSITIQEKNS